MLCRDGKLALVSGETHSKRDMQGHNSFSGLIFFVHLRKVVVPKNEELEFVFFFFFSVFFLLTASQYAFPTPHAHTHLVTLMTE